MSNTNTGTSVKERKAFSAVTLRLTLIVIFCSMIVGVVAASWYGVDLLRDEAVVVNTAVKKAEAIDQTNTRTTQLWDSLQENRFAVERAQQVVAESKSYAYQDVIIRDLNTFARKANIAIVNYDFTVASAATTPEEPPTERTTPSDDAESPAAPAQNQPASALKTTSVNISVKTPVSYKNLLTFIHYIEQSLTKMQVAKISLSRSSTDAGKNNVTTDTLTIEVYVR